MTLTLRPCRRTARSGPPGACDRTSRRGLKFVVVGVAGFLLQLGALATLTAVLHVHWLWATVAAVECAILHNYWWHARWTWRDRGRQSGLSRLARFHASTAVTSIGGNVALMTLLVALWRIDPLPANAIAVTVVSAANFLIADRWVFRGGLRAASAAMVALELPAAASAAPPPAALIAWRQAVAEVERAMDRSAVAARPEEIFADGDSIGVTGGTLSRWRGSVFIRGVTLDQLLQRLQHPGTPPPQDDIVAARVLGRTPDGLRVSIRLVRRAIVSVTYDTEHEMSFRRRSPTSATARSEATRIEEVGGGDKGLLWKLNSYWQYDETADGVIVRVETLTLSRDVPLLVRPIAGPIVRRVARESMVRTLAALRDYMQSAISHQPSAISFQPSPSEIPISHEPSAIRHSRLAISPSPLAIRHQPYRALKMTSICVSSIAPPSPSPERSPTSTGRGRPTPTRRRAC